MYQTFMADKASGHECTSSTAALASLSRNLRADSAMESNMARFVNAWSKTGEERSADGSVQRACVRMVSSGQKLTMEHTASSSDSLLH